MKVAAICEHCVHHEELHDQTDEGELNEDLCICKINQTDYHYNHCLNLDDQPCPYFRGE